jgi:hypothetical protein
MRWSYWFGGLDMTSEAETLGAAGTATEGRYETGQVSFVEYRIGKEWANSAWFALDHCDPEDVAHICSTLLAELETGGPVMGDLLGTVTGDALFWADCAPVHELVAYGMAALDRLRGIALGLDIRKRLFAKLWETFDPKDRQAFLTRVDAEGRLVRKGAA